MVEAFGMTVVSIKCSKHWKVRVRRRDGSERVVSFPTSTSDHRAMRNKRSQIQNIANGAE